MVHYGLIDLVTPLLAPLSPLRPLARVGIELSDPILAAGLIAILVEFGTAGATAAVQTYVNRRVPLTRQGTTFGIQSVVSNGLNVVGTLAAGALATDFGTKIVF